MNKKNHTFFFFFNLDGACEWYVCEGFQLVLKKQAEALESLGVSPQMKVFGCQCELFMLCVLQKVLF